MLNHARVLLCVVCSLLVGCAAAPPFITKEHAPPVKNGQGKTVDRESDRERTLWATLQVNGMLKTSPHLLADDIKMIPENTKVLVSGYDESNDRQSYLKVSHDGDSGYVSAGSFTMTGALKEFITSEREMIFQRNLETLKVIQNNQKEIESEKGWVKSMLMNVRTTPSLSSLIKDYLERGSEIFIQEEVDDWYRIRYDGPVIDYGASSYTDIAAIVNSYKDYSDLVSAYNEGWARKSDIADKQTEMFSDDEKRRWIFVKENPDMPGIIQQAIMSGEIIIGMSRDMVIASWGTPDEIASSRSTFDDHEQWIYGDTYIYFENGILNAWQNFDE